jgi:rod shape-determining protein MreC
MDSFFSRYKNVLVLLVVLVVQLLALAIQAKRPAKDAPDTKSVSLIRYAVVMVITPPEKALHGMGQWFRHLWFGYFDLVHVRRENADLKDQLERLRLEQASVVEDARQGQRLQQLLGFKEHYIYQTVAAQVIGTSGTDESGIVYLDKGSNDGVKTDMPVMTADGIVGRVKDVFPSTSQLLLISDATSAVGVILESTRTRGIMKGSTYGQVQVINVSPDDRIKPGQRFITSGGDQVFPRGMPVGVIDRVEPDPDRDPLLDVVVHPLANLSRLDEVLIVTNMGDTASSQEAKDLAESEAEGEAAQKRASDILSERLPSRVDPTAPADTNPDDNVDTTGNLVKPLVPPKTQHPDGFTPGATPPASELTPGQRIVPVKNGTEEVPEPKAQPVKKTTDGAAAAGSTATGATPHATTAGTGTAGATGVGAAKRPTTATGTAAAPVRSGGPAGTPGASTTRPAGASPGGAARTTAPATSSTTGGLKPDTKTHVIVDGPSSTSKSTAATPKPSASTTTSKPPAKKGPALVPNDGSTPPAVKPRPVVRPATPQGATPQNQGAA